MQANNNRLHTPSSAHLCKFYILITKLFTKEDADELCPNSLRLFFMQIDDDEYNNAVISTAPQNLLCVVLADTVRNLRKKIYCGIISALLGISVRIIIALS